MFVCTSLFSFYSFPSPNPVESKNARKKKGGSDHIKCSTGAIFIGIHGVGKFSLSYFLPSLCNFIIISRDIHTIRIQNY